MHDRSVHPLTRYLPHVLLATGFVVLTPLAAVWAGRDLGLLGGGIPSLILAVVVSLIVSKAAAAYWKTRPASGDLLFGDLMLWGWVHRWYTERQLASARDLVDSATDDHLGHEQLTTTLTQLAGTLEARDPYTHGHSRRVARHAWMIARKMGLTRQEAAKIRLAGILHDVGTVNTPKQILRKPGQLTEAEFEVVKRHPDDGADMVAVLGDDELTRIVRYHHERLDATGYPAGLAGTEIPIGARIIAVADTFDAITSTRPYRSARAHRKALAILTAEAGTQLDGVAVRAFVAYYSSWRPLVLWQSLANLFQRIAGIGGDFGFSASVGKVVAATAATTAVGTAAVNAAVFAHPTQVTRTASRNPIALRSDRGGNRMPTTLSAGRSGAGPQTAATPTHRPRSASNKPNVRSAAGPAGVAVPIADHGLPSAGSLLASPSRAITSPRGAQPSPNQAAPQPVGGSTPPNTGGGHPASGGGYGHGSGNGKGKSNTAHGGGNGNAGGNGGRRGATGGGGKNANGGGKTGNGSASSGGGQPGVGHGHGSGNGQSGGSSDANAGTGAGNAGAGGNGSRGRGGGNGHGAGHVSVAPPPARASKR